MALHSSLNLHNLFSVMEAEMDCPLLPIIVDNLILRAGQKILLDGISLHISQPGITAIMGPNGAGKSLFIRCLNRTTTPNMMIMTRMTAMKRLTHMPG